MSTWVSTVPISKQVPESIFDPQFPSRSRIRLRTSHRHSVPSESPKEMQVESEKLEGSIPEKQGYDDRVNIEDLIPKWGC